LEGGHVVVDAHRIEALEINHHVVASFANRELNEPHAAGRIAETPQQRLQKRA
jgi:hypothetical protein